ncbi:MAG: T9SS type A sorting domain-containing protein [Bacteroidetes bacterium]|nr:T9SS type A sorting domain-containing protein [Bacteroidota bacterium]
MFPIPTHDQLEVLLPQRTTGELVISNLLGRQVYKEMVSDKQRLKLSLGLLAPGFYTLTFLDGASFSSEKFLIIR